MNLFLSLKIIGLFSVFIATYCHAIRGGNYGSCLQRNNDLNVANYSWDANKLSLVPE